MDNILPRRKVAFCKLGASKSISSLIGLKTFALSRSFLAGDDFHYLRGSEPLEASTVPNLKVNSLRIREFALPNQAWGFFRDVNLLFICEATWRRQSQK